MKTAEEAAEHITGLLLRNDYSEAAYRLMKIPDNGRRTLVRLRVERHLTEPQVTLFGLHVFRLMSDADVSQAMML
jgi:hypothetical protein